MATILIIVLIFFLISSISVILLFAYHILTQVNTPSYKLIQLENKTEELYIKVTKQIEARIQEPYMKKYNEYYLSLIQQEKKKFFALKEKTKLLEEQLVIYENWQNYLLKIYRPEYHTNEDLKAYFPICKFAGENKIN